MSGSRRLIRAGNHGGAGMRKREEGLICSAVIMACVLSLMIGFIWGIFYQAKSQQAQPETPAIQYNLPDHITLLRQCPDCGGEAVVETYEGEQIIFIR